jgi:hypothetical protein
MSDHAGRPDEQRLEELSADLHEFVASASAWRIRIGPIAYRRRVSAEFVFLLFTSFHIAGGVSGALLIVFGKARIQSLGIALLVGSLFAFGSFLAQFWSEILKREHDAQELVFGDLRREEARNLSRRWRNLQSKERDESDD